MDPHWLGTKRTKVRLVGHKRNDSSARLKSCPDTQLLDRCDGERA
jgi:hypothetical protein